MTEMFLSRREGSIFWVKSKRKDITVGYFNSYEALNKRHDYENEKKHSELLRRKDKISVQCCFLETPHKPTN